MTDAPFIWAPEAPWTRLTVVAFRYALPLTAAPSEARIRLFAHSHYRLHVNGVHVAAGPARSHPDHPSYDEVDLRPYLSTGDNILAVLVAHCGAYSFHHVPAPGCLVAWGEVDGRPFSTASGWTCCVSRGHAADAPPWSFAIPMTEICDERAWPRGWDRPGTPAGDWRPAVTIDRSPWGTLAPCPIPQLTQDVRRHIRVHSARLHAQGETLHGFRLIQDRDITRIDFPAVRALASTWIHSETARSVVMGTWWGEHGLNGEALAQAQERPDAPMRRDAVLTLRPGWNLLVISYGLVQGVWECQVALPDDLRVDASRGTAAEPIAFRSAGPFPVADLEQRWTGFPMDDAGLRALSADWRDHAHTRVPVSPQRHLAWARPAEVLPVDQGRPFPLRIPVGRRGSVVLDFGRIVLGRVRVRLRAPVGTHVDLVYTEELLGDRPHYHKMAILTGADRRVIGADGTFTTFFRRGFRYLEVGIAGHDADVHLDEVVAVEERYPFQREGSFACSDPRLTILWESCRETLRLCAEDVFTDCPWRERTLYGGDLFVETAVNAVISGDLRLVRRSVEVYLQCHNEDGGVGGRAPAPRGKTSGGEFQLMVLLTACWYGRLSGDTAALRAWMPRLRAILAGCASRDEATGLHPWSNSFIEHTNVQKKGLVTAANAVLAAAHRAIATAMEQCGTDGSAERALADGLAEAIRRATWDEDAGCFWTGIGDADAPGERHQLHAGFHAGCWGCTDAHQDARQVAVFRDRLRALAADPRLREHDFHGRIDHAFSAYGCFYLLAWIARLGEAGLAEETIATWYADMIDHPTGTVWEQFESGKSLTHAWAAAPAWYASTQILGVQLGPDPATPLDHVLVAPQSETIDWAEGAVPHPKGLIHVRWEVRGECLDVRVRAPKGVRVVVAPRGRLGRLRLLRDGVLNPAPAVASGRG